ncbi:MAG: hypothetical protein ACKO1V_05230 [Cyanobium sp.]
MTAAFSTPITTLADQDGVIEGPWRKPINLLRAQTYDDHASIHDDATAQKLGFRGGTIEGPTHFSQITPLLVHLWGTEWFENGAISANYRNASYEGEEVKAQVKPTSSSSAQISVLKLDGTVVLTGSGAIGSHAEPGVALAKLQRAHPLIEPRILKGASIGMRVPSRVVRMDYAQRMGDLYPFSLQEKLANITEPSPFYERSAATPWNRPVMPVEMISVLCQHLASDDGFPVSFPVVGLFADQEISLRSGPVSPELDYRLEREIIALTETPKTESMWLRSRLFRDDSLIAEMTLNQAFLKASSPLYA